MTEKTIKPTDPEAREVKAEDKSQATARKTQHGGWRRKMFRKTMRRWWG